MILLALPPGFSKIWDDPYLTLLACGLIAAFATIILVLVVKTIPINSLGEIWKLFLGVEVPPALVGWIRAVTTGVISSAALAIGRWAGVDTDSVVVTGAVMSVVGSFWGLIDQWKKRLQNADNPPPVAGGPDLPKS